MHVRILNLNMYKIYISRRIKKARIFVGHRTQCCKNVERLFWMHIKSLCALGGECTFRFRSAGQVIDVTADGGETTSQ
jgi:rRNA maturation endonuclease Nob1